MIKLAIVSESSSGDFSALEARLKSALTDSIRAQFSIDGPVEAFVGRRNGVDSLTTYHDSVVRLENLLSQLDPSRDRMIGILDLASANDATEILALTTLPGTLLLSFPEVVWVPLYRGTISCFLSGMNSDMIPENPFSTLRGSLEMCRAGYSPLFDGDGLRSTVISNRIRKDASEHRNRSDVAVALDEERQFAYMNAYVAYRFGYRAIPVVTRRCANFVVGRDWLFQQHKMTFGGGTSNDGQGALRPRLVVFEDVCLEFPDHNEYGDSDSIGFGAPRDRVFPLLEHADMRIITTAAMSTERIAHDDAHGNLTCGQYFAGKTCRGKMVRNVSRANGVFFDRCIRSIAKSVFNFCSGWWCGYWLVNAVVAVMAVALLTTVFFWNPVCLLPSFVLCFLFLGVAGEIVNEIAKRRPAHTHGVLAFLKRRQQWQYMPKQYQNYRMTPLSDDGLVMYWCEARKPLAGIFGLRNRVGLPTGRDFNGIMSSKDVEAAHRSFMRHCVTDADLADQESNGHAAPGMAVEIASVLIHRAEKTKSQITGVEGAIYGAVLANTALELLRNKTPALSVEALGLRHYYEVLAECEFIGVQATLDMNDRYVDIHNSMWKLCRSSEGTLRDDVFVCGMAKIIDQLSSVLREHGKLEECAYFTRISRRLHRQMKNPIIRSLLAYPEWMLRSRINFCLSFFLSIVLFCAFCMIKIQCDFVPAVKTTYLVLLANQPDINAAVPGFAVVGQVMRQVALIHIAFLAAAFYDFMNRK